METRTCVVKVAPADLKKQWSDLKTVGMDTPVKDNIHGKLSGTVGIPETLNLFSGVINSEWPPERAIAVGDTRTRTGRRVSNGKAAQSSRRGNHILLTSNAASRLLLPKTTSRTGRLPFGINGRGTGLSFVDVNGVTVLNAFRHQRKRHSRVPRFREFR